MWKNEIIVVSLWAFCASYASRRGCTRMFNRLIKDRYADKVQTAVLTEYRLIALTKTDVVAQIYQSWQRIYH